MSDLQQIKNKLLNQNKIEELLESIGCLHIKVEQRGQLITAQLPEKFGSHNKRSVQVRMKKGLPCYIRNMPDFEGDIYNLISYIHFDKRGKKDIAKNLSKSKNYICNLFGWREYLGKSKGDVVVKDYTASLKEIINSTKKRNKLEPNPVLPDNIMNEYYLYGKPLPFQDWIDEGISYQIQELYGVGFCLESKRVVFPLMNRFGKIVGVKGRIMKDEDDLERKYLYLHSCNISQEWFNLHYAQPYILMDKKVIIVESEKSCMKFASNGIWNTLAIGSSDISEEQVRIIEGLGKDVEVYLAYDKDKTIKEIKSQAEKFKNNNVYGIFDTDDLLSYKDSPIDRGVEVWNKLYENNLYQIKTKAS